MKKNGLLSLAVSLIFISSVLLSSITVSFASTNNKSSEDQSTVDADKYRVLKVRMTNPTDITDARVYWQKVSTNKFSEEHSVGFKISARDTSPKVYIIELHKSLPWRGTVTKIKIDDPSGRLKDQISIIDVYLRETKLMWQELRFERSEDGKPNSDLRKYYEPELLKQWEQTRKVVDELLVPGVRVPKVGKYFGKVVNDAGMRVSLNIAPKRMNVKWTEIEINSLKKGGINEPYSINLQSVLSKYGVYEDPKTMQKKYDDIISIMNWMKENYPNTKVGITGALYTKGHDYKKFYMELKNRIDKENKNRKASKKLKLSFIELDHAQNFEYDFLGKGKGAHEKFWGGLKEYARFIHEEMDAEFYAIIGMRYTKTNEQYYNYTIQIPELFRKYEVKCDAYNIRYWWGKPDRELPENVKDVFSATKTILKIHDEITFKNISKVLENEMLSDGNIISPIINNNESKVWRMNMAAGWDKDYYNTSKPEIKNGVLVYEVKGKRPHITSGGNLDTSLDQSPQIKIRIKNNTTGKHLRVHFKKQNDPDNWKYTAAELVKIKPNSNDFEEYIIDMSENQKWNGTLKQLRLVIPFGANSGSVEIDSISLGKFK